MVEHIQKIFRQFAEKVKRLSTTTPLDGFSFFCGTCTYSLKKSSTGGYLGHYFNWCIC